MAEVVLAAPATPGVARTVNVTAKAGLVLMLVLAMLYPDLGHLRDKGAGARAVGYPLASFAVPFVWWVAWRDRVAFPWLPDLLVTITCFTDVLGNRMDLYDTVLWFDDWMHFMNTGLLAAAVVLLTMPPHSSLGRVVERALAFGATAAIAWELAEYVAFLSRSSERQFAYADTLGDLTLGVLGSLVAAVVVHQVWSLSRGTTPAGSRRWRRDPSSRA